MDSVNQMKSDSTPSSTTNSQLTAITHLTHVTVFSNSWRRKRLPAPNWSIMRAVGARLAAIGSVCCLALWLADSKLRWPISVGLLVAHDPHHATVACNPTIIKRNGILQWTQNGIDKDKLLTLNLFSTIQPPNPRRSYTTSSCGFLKNIRISCRSSCFIISGTHC